MSLSALLLAGGESRRMGVDKATLTIGGTPLWQRQIALLRELEPEELFIAVRRIPAWAPDEGECLLDLPPSRGPLSGLAVGLARSQSSHLVVLAVDMPFMTSAHLRLLCELTRPGCGVMPFVNERAEPLAALYPREAREEISSALAGDDFSLQALARLLIGSDKLQPVRIPRTNARFTAA